MTPLALALSRAGVAVEPMAIALAMALIAGAGFAAGGALMDEAGAVGGLAVTGLVCLCLLSRVWPVFSVPYLATLNSSLTRALLRHVTDKRGLPSR